MYAIYDSDSIKGGVCTPIHVAGAGLPALLGGAD